MYSLPAAGFCSIYVAIVSAILSGALLASFLTIGEHAVAFTPEGLFVTDADPRQVFAIVRGSEILPLDDFIAANRRETLFDEGFKAAGAK